MTSLASYERDLGLPARAGQADLVLPDAGELLERFGAVLRGLLGAPPCGAELLHARWKPGVAVAGSYLVHAEDGAQVHVSLKRHRGLKAEAQALGGPDATAAWSSDVAGELLFTPEADRELPGLAVALGGGGLRRLARAVRESGCLGDLQVRKRASSMELLRYKPERRAVLRVDLKTRQGEGLRDQRRLALRVLAPARAAALAADRAALFAESRPGFLPELAFFDARLGWLAEPWLPGVVDEHRSRSSAQAVGQLLRRLHALPLASGLAPTLRPLDLGPLAVAPELHERGRALAAAWPPEPASRALVLGHGDLHADQVLWGADAPSALLDLDELGVRPAEEDLASWIADELAEQPDLGLAAASRDLLAGYGGLDLERLVAPVGRQLLRLAAAAPRRLERAAVARAEALVRTAESLVRP